MRERGKEVEEHRKRLLRLKRSKGWDKGKGKPAPTAFLELFMIISSYCLEILTAYSLEKSG